MFAKQIFCKWGSSSSLDCEAQMAAPKATGNTSPFEMHDGNLSRFVFRIQDHSDGGNGSVSVNIPAADVPYLKRMTDIAFEKKANFVPSENSTSPAYTEVLAAGKLKGMTPAQALLTGKATVEDLESTRNFLEVNLTKYPRNQKSIDAINDAIRLYKAGELTEAGASSGAAWTVYKEDVRLSRIQTSDGFRRVMSVLITCEFSKTYPWTVQIVNQECPVSKTVQGNVVPELSKGRNRVTKKISLNDKDWSHVIDQMENHKRMFELAHFAEMTQISEDVLRKSREEYLRAQGK